MFNYSDPNNTGLFPRHDINPKEKNDKWFIKYCEAALRNAETESNYIFSKSAKNYEEIRDYALGKQSNTRYKPMLGVEEVSDKSWYAIDWSIRPIISTVRDIVISKILLREFHITATPIDAMAKTKVDKFLAAATARIALKTAATQMGAPDLASMPALQPDDGEPSDADELQMQKNFGVKLSFAAEAEEGVKYIYNENNIYHHRKKVVESLFDFGVGGYKEELLDDGCIKVRSVNVSNIISNFCRDNDFSDMVHLGEIIEVSLQDLAEEDKFTKEDLLAISEQVAGKDGNPKWQSNNTTYNMGYDGFKVQVLDIEILSYDDTVYEKRIDDYGNLKVGKTKYSKKFKDQKIIVDGKEVPRYTAKRKQNVYKGKWIIGTEYVYDFGLANNMKREPDKRYSAATSLSYHLYAYNFDNMRCQSYMMRLIPMIDEYQLTTYKLQNLKNRMVPNGWAIDLDALESIDLAKSGTNMTPLAVLDMYFQSGTLIYRGKDLDNTNPNRKPVELLQNSQVQELVGYASDLARIKQEMNMVCGLNEVTDASTPPERLQNAGYTLANEATNNALYPLVLADKTLLENTAKGVIMRLQIAVKNGDIEGIQEGLGDGAIKIIKITEAIAPYVWGIQIQDKPTDEERSMLLEQLNVKDQQGLIDAEDIVALYNMDNIKKARMYLAYKIKKNKAKMQQDALEQQQQTGQVQIQSAQAAEQAKQETLMLEHKNTMEEINLTNQWKYLIEELIVQGKVATAQHQTEAAVTKQMITSDAQENMQRREMGHPVDDPISDIPQPGQAPDLLARMQGGQGQGGAMPDVQQGGQPMQGANIAPNPGA
jgi:hypothetical protein